MPTEPLLRIIEFKIIFKYPLENLQHNDIFSFLKKHFYIFTILLVLQRHVNILFFIIYAI